MLIEKEIEERLLGLNGIEKVFSKGISTEATGNVKIKSKRLVKGVGEDLHEITITLVDDDEIQYEVSAYVMINAMLKVSDGHCNCAEDSKVQVMNVMYANEFEFSDDKKRLDIKFEVISNAEKVKE
jgi:hypothetical protein